MRSNTISFIMYFGLIIINPVLSFAQNEQLNAQKRDTLKEVERLLKKIEIEDSLAYDQLIAVWDDPTTNDSVRVEIAYLILKFPHSKGIQLLINNIEKTFNYGRGVSGLDQFNIYVSSGILYAISADKNEKWKLLIPILECLKIEKRSETFILKVGNLLVSLSNKEIAKSILETELQESKETMRRFRNLTYEYNLLQMLKNLQ